ncbi:MAG: glycoside hydrolase family 55 protein, partial [Kiritimatiellaeota bacterium]|nr:glycoside hydrolase family 55 protein [Kiritimatiellota bacterium]
MKRIMAIGVCVVVGMAAQAETLTYTEPFGLAWTDEVVRLAVKEPIVVGTWRLVDAAGKEVPLQVGEGGTSVLVRSSMKANETLSWTLEKQPSTMTQEFGDLVRVTEDREKGWYEVSNGVIGMRLANGTDATLAPLQGIRLKDGRWTANGPAALSANATCTGVSVEILERGPFEFAARFHYTFADKPEIPRIAGYEERCPGFPGGDGFYTCTLRLAAGDSSIIVEEHSDVLASWALNVFPELRCDMARHPSRLGEGGGYVEVRDTAVPAAGERMARDYHPGAHLLPWGNHYAEYFWMLFDSQGDAKSPVVGVFADQLGWGVYDRMSGPGLVYSDDWMGSGKRGGGFAAHIVRTTPDAFGFPYVRIRWGIYVGTKGEDIPESATAAQPIVAAMNLHGGMATRPRDVFAPIPQLPKLDWVERSDWVNVKAHGAKGDGVADDTAAIQAALDLMPYERSDIPCTVYLPPGTYRITRTLRMHHKQGVHLVGHGRDTRIVWDGTEAPHVMYHSDGASVGMVYEGIVWDGAGKAHYGINHCSNDAYETQIVHRNEAFYNMGAAILTGWSDYFPYRQATAETLVDNCLFVNVGGGITYGCWNALNNTVVDSGFYYCGKAVWSNMGNFYVRRCHFEGSRDVDLCSRIGDNTALRCTSVGSRRFLESQNGAFVMQDCHVEGWTSITQPAVTRGSIAPFTIFDCAFTRPPSERPPVEITPDAPMMVSNCTIDGTNAVISAHPDPLVIPKNTGRLGGSVTSSRQTFFKSDITVSQKIFDARRDFGAVGDGTADDTAALKATIAAAREHGKGATAYIPHGKYLVKETLDIFGINYIVAGAGLGWQTGTMIVWGGAVGTEEDPVPVL